jgi:hypothetical protein
MRSNLSLIPAPLIALSLLAACGSANGETRVAKDGNGPLSTRSFNLGGFDAVVLAASDDVRIVRGDAFSVTATATAEILDRLQITVDGDTLKIGRKRTGTWFNWNDNQRSAKITVTLPTLKQAVLAGSGDMRVDTTAADQFEGKIAGSGNLDIATSPAKKIDLSVAGSGNLRAQSVAADALEANIAGSGDLTVSGTTKTAELSIAGSGDIDAGALTAEFANASVAGSGNIRVRATVKAETSIIGSGDIEVAGTNDCAVSKRGSGDVRCTS